MTAVILLRSLSEAERGQLSRVVWQLSVTGNVLLVALLVVNVASAAPSPGPILLALVYKLAIAALLFVRLLLTPQRTEDA